MCNLEYEMTLFAVYKLILVWLCLAWAPLVVLAMLLWPLVRGKCGVATAPGTGTRYSHRKAVHDEL